MDVNRVVFVRLPPFMGYRHPHPQNLLIPFEAAQMATILSLRGYSVHIVDAWAEGLTPSQTMERIVAARPQLVAMETATPTVNLARRIIQGARQRQDFVVVAFGQHATALPGTILGDGSFLACIKGEGEATLPHLLEVLGRGGRLSEVPGILWYRDTLHENAPRPYLDDLDSLPFIDYRLLARRRYYMSSCSIPRFRPTRWGFVLSSRGCPFRCIYCSPTLRFSYGKRYRAHSPEYVVDNIEYLVRAHGVNAISLPDDVFTLDRDRTAQICHLLRKKGLRVPWVCQTRADCLDPLLIREMKAGGCVGVCLGVESGSERVLQCLRKDMSKEQIRRVVRELHAAGIAPTLFFMVGSPTETYEEFRETLAFACELRPLIIQVAYFTPYPGSPVFEELHQSSQQPGALTQLSFDDYSHYNRASFNLSAIDDQRFRTLQRDFYRRYYLRAAYLRYYIRRRLPYAVFNARHELGLIRAALTFLARPPKAGDMYPSSGSPRRGASACGKESQPAVGVQPHEALEPQGGEALPQNPPRG
ncbi:MAG: radical SAM protein [Bacillota bacterium]